jgi:hypothetical protein
MAGWAASGLGMEAWAALAPATNLGFTLTDASAAGLDFHHNSGAYGGKLPETLGSGARVFDYDA